MKSYLMFLRKNILPAGIFLITFGLYVSTLAPGWGAVNIFNTWDGLEYVLSSCLLGIDHPPGHPLYILLGRIFTLLPLGSPAFLMNLMSAFFGAAASCMVFLVIDEFMKAALDNRSEIISKSAAAFSALLLAVSRVFWTHSVITEVHTLYLFLVSTGIFFLFKFISGSPVKWLYASAAAFGLALSVSLFSAATFGAAFFVFLSLIYFGFGDKRVEMKHLLCAFGIFLAGIIFYVYYPLRAGAATFSHSMNYLSPHKFGSLPWFFWYISGKAWTGGGMFSLARIFGNLPNYFYHLRESFTFPAVLLAALPAFFCFKQRKIDAPAKMCIFLLLALVFVALPELTLEDPSNPGSTTYIYVANFYLPSFLIAVILSGIGFGVLFEFLRAKDLHLKLIRIFSRSPSPSGSSKAAWTLLFFCVILVLPTVLFAKNFRQCSLRGKNEGYIMAKDMLETAPRDSVIMSKLIYQLVLPYFTYIDPVAKEKNITLLNPDVIGKELVETNNAALPMLSRARALKDAIRAKLEGGMSVFIAGDSIDQDKAPEVPLISDVDLEPSVPAHYMSLPPGSAFSVTELLLYEVKGLRRAMEIDRIATFESRGISNDGNFAEKLELVGYDMLPSDQRFGRNKINIRFYWRVKEAVGEDLIGIFAVYNERMQRIDPSRTTGFYSVGGEFAPSKWSRGSFIREDASFYLPSLPSGSYFLALGLLRENGDVLPYYPADFERYGRHFDFILLLPFGVGAPPGGAR